MSAQTQTAMSIGSHQVIQQWKSPEQIQARITAIRKMMTNVLVENVDYGIIPGMPAGTKPSLWKSGSEHILSMFGIAVEPVVEDLSGEDCYRYRVTARLTNAVTGEFLGAGVGEASSDETKYKWKRTYSKAEWDHTPADRRRIKYGQRRDGNQYVEYEELQIRQEPADVANTVLKIAKKRSQIDGTLTVTGASGTFGQDLDEDSEEAAATRQRPSRSKKAAPAPTGDVMCAECRAINGHLPSCSYRKKQEEVKPEAAKTEKPKELKWLVNVEAMDQRSKVQKDKKGEEYTQHFRILTCMNAANEKVTLYAWDTKLFERLDRIKPNTKCIFTVKSQETNGKTYYAIDAIIEISGEKKQADAQETEDFE